MRQLIPRGFTIVELIVTLMLMAMLVALGAPMMSDYLRNARLREAANTILTALQFARGEAIKRNQPLAFRVDGNDLSITSPAGEVIRHERLSEGSGARVVRISDGEVVDSVVFGGAGRPSPFGSEFRIETSLAGLSCAGEHRCPRVMLRSGGGVRLCPQAEDC